MQVALFNNHKVKTKVRKKLLCWNVIFFSFKNILLLKFYLKASYCVGYSVVSIFNVILNFQFSVFKKDIALHVVRLFCTVYTLYVSLVGYLNINFIIDGWIFKYLYGWLLNYPTDLVKHKSIIMSDFSKVFLKAG